MNLLLDPVGKEQAPVTSEGMNKTIERYLAEYARKHLGKPLTSAPNSNFPDFFLLRHSSNDQTSIGRNGLFINGN